MSAQPAAHDVLAIPMSRMGQVGVIVDALLCLDAARSVTAAVLQVDGRQHAGRG